MKMKRAAGAFGADRPADTIGGDGLLPLQSPLQPDGTDVHGVVQTGFFALFEDPFLHPQVGISGHKLDLNLIGYGHVAHSFGGQNLHHDDAFIRHIAVI